MKKSKTQPLTMREYYEKPIFYSREEEIKKLVAKEEAMNKPYKPVIIPKDMKYPKREKMNDAPFHAFIKSIYSYLP